MLLVSKQVTPITKHYLPVSSIWKPVKAHLTYLDDTGFYNGLLSNVGGVLIECIFTNIVAFYQTIAMDGDIIWYVILFSVIV